MNRFRIPAVILSLLVGLLCIGRPVTSQADVLFTYGYSPRGIGMGGALSATADDFAAAYYNPAGTAFQRRPSFGLGCLVTGSKMTGIGIEAPDLDHTQGLIFGTTLPLPFGSFLTDRLSFGAVVFLPDGVLLGITVPTPVAPQYVILQNSGRSLTLIPTMGLKLHRGIALGGGVQLFDNTCGELNATVDSDGTIQATVGQELLTSFAAVVGVLFRPGDYWASLSGWRIGMVFRDRFFTKYDIPVYTSIGDVPLTVGFQATSLYTPRQWVFGVAYERSRWMWEVDISYNEWSDFPDPNLEIDIDFTIPILPITFQGSEIHTPGFHDTTTVRAGMEVTAYTGAQVDLLVRTGYSFDPSPVPNQRGVTNYLDTDRHIGALSLGWAVRGVGNHTFEAPMSLDLVGQAQLLTERVAYKNDDVDPGNPGYPKVGFSGVLYLVGATFSAEFDFE